MRRPRNKRIDMKIEDIETAVRLKKRRDSLLMAKDLIERNPTGIVVKLLDGDKEVSVEENNLVGTIYKYCTETIALIEKNIEQL